MSDYIIFTIDKSHYALEVTHIERIDQIPSLTAIPNAHPYIDGMMTYQEQTAKVINFRKMSEALSSEPPISTQKLLIYREGEDLFGIKVDGIRDITTVDDKQIKPYAHSVSVGSFIQTRGVIDYQGTLVIIIESIRLPQESGA